MNDQTTQVDDLQLVAVPSAVNCTDLFVRFTLAEWCLQPMLDEVTDTANRLVKAAVGNADSRETSIIAVRLRLRGEELLVEIEDGRAEPRLAVPAELSEKNCGVGATGGGGQLLWCALPLPGGTDASAVPLPRRGTTKTATAVEPAPENETAEMDPEVMQRILAALTKSSNDRAD